MVDGPFLVTGATGTTGNAVARELRRRAHRVRAVVRRTDDRSRALQSLGVEVVEGNLLDIESLRSATRNVVGAYFACPVGPDLVEASVKFAQAAEEEALKIVVNLSILPARPDAGSPESLGHWLSERVFANFGVPSTALRPTFFMDNLLSVKDSIKRGRLVFPWKPSSVHRPISAMDIARVTASVLADPAKHAGKIYPLHGAAEYSYTEIAALLSHILGRDVNYEQVTACEMVEMMGMGKNTYLQRHFETTKVDYDSGIFSDIDETSQPESISRRITLDEFIRANRSAFV